MSNNLTAKAGQPDLFKAAVADSFAFLEQDYGFSKDITQPNQHSVIVRYENALLYVNVMFGPPAYEPEMSFGRRGVDDAPEAFSFEAGDLVQLPGWDGDMRNPSLAEPIANQVNFLANILRGQGQACLNNNTATYEKMKARRFAAITEWQDNERGKAVARQIEAAWQIKDYRNIVEVCAQFSGVLSAVDAKRLAIAKDRF